MNRLILILTNDLKRRLRAPTSVLVMLSIPLLMTAIIGMIFAPRPGATQLPKIKVLVVNHDTGLASKLLLGAFDQGEVKEMFQLSLVDAGEGERLMAKGEASAMMVIPADFSARYLKGEQVSLEVVKNPAEQFLPAVVEEFVGTLAVMGSGLGQVFAEELRAIDLLTQAKLAEVSVTDMVPFMERGKRKLETLNRVLNPLLLKLKKEAVGTEKKPAGPAFNVFAVLLPGLAVMFLLFILEIVMRDLLTERLDGRLRRMMFAPVSGGEVVLARILGGWLMGVVVVALMFLAGWLLFSIRWLHLGHHFLLTAATCLALACFFALLNAFFRNRNQAGAFTAPIILVFSAFGGSMLPIQQLPGVFRGLSRFTPNYWFIEGTARIQQGSFPGQSLAVFAIAALVLFPLAGFALSRRVKG